VYLATIGTAAAYTPRLTYAKNLFEAGGIRTISGEPDGIADAPTSVACLCSSDRLYRDGGDDAVARLRSAGATRVLVAGRKVRPAGVDEEIGMGSDVLAVLTRALDELGVTP
jgi:methylmalonyl-CoA mutase